MIVNYDAARAFLVKVAPWPAEGEEGYINIHWSQKKEDGKLYWLGRAYKSPADAVNFIQWVSTQPGGKNFYVCMSSQKVAEKKISQNGWEYLKAIRLHSNILLFKSIWLDLDFKGYESEEATIKAFAEFLAATKLPPPSVYVNTGGGIHIYWTFSEPMTYEVWHPVALALAEAAKRHGLRADTQCTADSARILRIPDTFNYKYDPPRRVRFLTPPKDFDYLLERVAAPLEPYKTQSTSAQKLPENDLSAGIGAFAPIDIARVLPNCPHLQETIRDHGANLKGQPIWALNGLLSTFTTQGRALFHILSKGSPYYNREDTDALYDRKERERKEKNIGWPTCAAIELAGATACRTCPHREEHKSPLHFNKPKLNGAHHPAAVSTIQYLPDGYRHKEDMKIVQVTHNEEGVEMELPVTNWPAYDGWLEEQNDGSLKLYFTTELKKLPKIVNFPTAIVASQVKLSESLSSQGCEVPKPQQKVVGEFSVAWMSKLKAVGAFKSTSSFGWNASNGELTGFNYAGHLWTPNGSIPAATNNSSGSEHYAPIGSLSVWKEAAALIVNQDRNQLNALLSTSFAAPLVRFTGQSAFLVSGYSPESGTQKTSALKTAQAVWGHPVKAMQSLNDTDNAVFNKLGLTNSLPLYWDEMGATVSSRYRDTIKMLMQLTSGREKARLDANSQTREVKTWNNILTCASNNSLKDYVASQSNISAAAMNRVTEFRVPLGRQGMISDPKATRIIANLEGNYGQAGLLYAQYLGHNFTRIGDEMQAMLEAISTEVDSDPSERFWLANVCCMLLGAKYAKELDLVDINTFKLKEFLLHNFDSMRVDRKEQIVDFNDVSVVAQAVNQFIDEIGNDHIIRTNKMHEKGKPVDVTLEAAMPRSTPFVQITPEVIRVGLDQFSRWLRERSRFADSYVSVLKKIIEHEGVTKRKATIGAGITLPGGSSQKPVLDFDTSKISDLMTEPVTPNKTAGENKVLQLVRPS